MAEETITAAVTECHLEQKNESKTDGLLLGNFIKTKYIDSRRRLMRLQCYLPKHDLIL